MDDARGFSRGKCKRCADCDGYAPPDTGLKCAVCYCPPAAHVKMDTSRVSPEVSHLTVSDEDWISVKTVNPQFPTSTCAMTVCFAPGCNQQVDFDIHSGQEYNLCSIHLTEHPPDQGLFVEDIETNYFEDYTNVPAYQCPVQGGETLSMCQSACWSMTGVHDGAMFSAIAPTAAIPAQAGPKDSSLCIIPECPRSKYVDLNSGATHDYCGKTHAEEGKRRGILSPLALPESQFQAVSPPPTQGGVHLAPGGQKCAILECSKPCFVDESGTVHECCGITHAMEHQRRQALWQQVNHQVVKGVTHCLLPECGRNTWPFENYCGRTHANLGQQKGLVPPSPTAGIPAQAGPKDNSLCIIPECQKPKFVDPKSGVTHDYCGKTHADQGKKMGILATTDKVEEQCDLPGCSNKKKTEGTATHDYCCQSHANQDAPNRDARILTSDSEVQNFLKKFSNLKVVSLKENIHAKPGGVLFNKFKNAMMSLPQSQRQTCLAFHGTLESNIDSIFTNGYDPKKRSGQAYGAGEYFATKPDIPLSYCKGGKKMLLNELLLGKQGTHHTKHGDIVVMQNPAHDLPRYAITFQ